MNEFRATRTDLPDVRANHGVVGKDAGSAKEIDAYVGSRIRERRETLGVSQGKLARALGLTFSQIQKYEKGSNRVGAGRLLLMAKALDVPVTFFFGPLADSGAEVARQGRPTRTPVLEPDAADLVMAFRAIPEPAARHALISLAWAMASVEDQVDRSHSAE